MKRLLLALVPWMVLGSAAFGQARSADVLYTHHDGVPQRAFRVGEEAFVPIDGVQTWGWTVETRGADAKVTAEGKTIDLSTRSIAGRPTIPLRRILEQLGAESTWEPDGDMLSVVAPITSIKVERGRVTVSAPLALKASTYALSGPNRVVVDLAGGKITGRTKKEIEPGARLFQYRPNVVRVVIETPVAPQIPLESIPESRDLSLEFRVVSNEEDASPADPFLAKGPLTVNLESDDAYSSRIVVGVGGQMSGPAQFTKPDSKTLEILLPFVRAQVPEGLKLDTDAVEEITSRRQGLDTVVRVRLSKAMGAEVSWTRDAVTIQLNKPRSGGGSLAGKVVVVDPGHGGSDKGARAGGVFEKNLNLKIGMMLARKLSEAGATVITTRTTDVFIPLGVRSDIANRNNADIFISTHINSTGGSGSQSGGITFHHLGSGISRQLAQSVQAEIAQVSKLPNLGVWSDGRIYQSGFAVLRGTNMPGVLLELGFINHPRDRARLVTKDFQEAVTSAVVRGLRNFLGDRGN